MGYPCNLDSCNQMHQVTSQAFSNAANNTVTYGSNMRGGSSGGPWIMNFGALSSCSEGCGGSDTGMNRIIGVDLVRTDRHRPALSGRLGPRQPVDVDLDDGVRSPCRQLLTAAGGFVVVSGSAGP